ncbi:MAG: glycosyltransferase family 4 protein, partial [Chloroflexi bacterium]|nr:glycosyltransferase family 4 protein [Chloroflexota bacterium]
WEGLRFRPDVIHGHMHEGALIGGMLACLLRVPLLFDFQGSLTAEMADHNFLDRNGRIYPWAHRLERFISVRLPQAILTSSIRAQRLLQEEFDAPPERIHPLPDCADTIRFNPAVFSPEAKLSLRRRLGIPDGRPIVAYLGLLTDYQGIPHLLQTAVQLKQAGENIHFLIMGYPNMPHYREMAKGLGVADWVTFTGKVEYRDAPYFLSLGDIGVAPKISSTEGSGKLLNYMALAQPVVAFDTAVHREYLVDLGVYAPAGDVSAFAAAIAALLRDPDRMADLGQKLRLRAENAYSWETAVNQIINLYQNLTRKS